MVARSYLSNALYSLICEGMANRAAEEDELGDLDLYTFVVVVVLHGEHDDRRMSVAVKLFVRTQLLHGVHDQHGEQRPHGRQHELQRDECLECVSIE